MKKILIFTMLFIYTVSVTGMNIQFHYCGGKIKSVSLLHHEDSEKGCCGKKMKSGKCCHDKTTTFKIKDSHSYSPSSKVPQSIAKYYVSNVPEISLYFISKNESYIIPDCHAPPVLQDDPLYLRYRVFLI